MKFTYTAVDTSGRSVSGEVDAPSSSAVLVMLTSRGLKPVTIKTESLLTRVAHTNMFGQAITLDDQIFLTRYLALMLRVGAGLSQIIEILIVDIEKPSLRAFLKEVQTSLEAGQSFYTTFARYPQYFSPVVINLIRAGERSGTLEATLENLSVVLDRERDFKSRITTALIYPVFLFVVAFLTMIFLVVFIVPRMAGFFASASFTPPLFSRIVFAIGGFLNHYLIVFIPILLLFVGIIWYALRFTIWGKRVLLSMIALLPVASEVYRKISLQRFATTFGLLMQSGIPIIESLEITAGVVSYPGMVDALYRVAQEGVGRGGSLGSSFRKEKVFPVVVSNLIAISEKAGHITDVLSTLAHFYETEVDTAMKRLISFLEPIMLLVIGAFVGLIALSVILPIYQLVGQF